MPLGKRWGRGSHAGREGGGRGTGLRSVETVEWLLSLSEPQPHCPMQGYSRAQDAVIFLEQQQCMGRRAPHGDVVKDCTALVGLALLVRDEGSQSRTVWQENV